MNVSTSRSTESRRTRNRAAFLALFAFLAMGLAMSSGRASSAISVVTARTSDTGDGYIDRISVTFSGPMDSSKVPAVAPNSDAPGFSVDGYAISSLQWEGATTLHLNLVQGQVYDTDATPMVRYVSGQGGALDPAGQELGSFARQAADGSGPVLVRATARDMVTTPASSGLFNAVGDTLMLHFSEPARLAGATPTDRWAHLERAIRFNPIAPQNACTDADGTLMSFNFPQPGSGADPIDAPASATASVSVWSVRHKASNVAPTHKFPAVPVGCRIGIDASGRNLVTDAAGNVAAHQNMPTTNAQRVWIEPADIQLVSARTVDTLGGAADGFIDGVELEFDQKIEEASVSDQLGNITVEHGGVAATITSGQVGTGSSDAERRILLRLQLPDGAQWDGSVRPSVSYAKPQSCTGGSGAGLKGPVPTAGFKACAASFAVAQAVDAAPAVVLGARTRDINGNGVLDRLDVTLSEPIAGGSAAGWKVDGRDATGFSIDANNARLVRITFPEGPAGDTGLLPAVRYTRQAPNPGSVDFGNNEVATANRSADVDGAAPRIRTATVRDTNSDGSIDRIDIVYSEPLAPVPAGIAANFTFGGVVASGVASAEGSALALTLGEVTGTGPKDLVYTAGSSIKDAANNISGDQSVAAGAIVDAAAPVGSVTITPGAPMSAGTKTVVATFTESMNTAIAPTVTVKDKSVAAVSGTGHTNGWRNDTPSVWEGTVEIVAADCDVPTGCDTEVQAAGAQDPAGNAPAAPVVLSTKIDTIAPVSATVQSFSATVRAGESVPADTINMFTNGFSLTVGVTAGDAEGGYAEILVGDELQPLQPAARGAVIGSDDTVATARTNFANREALQAALAEGQHVLSVRVCDAAQNCTVAAGSATITADYTPVQVTLDAPQGGDVVQGGSNLDITWTGDEAGEGFERVDIAYSTDGGTTYGNQIVGEQPLSGSYGWSVPNIDAEHAMVRVATVDLNGNKAFASTAEPFSIDSTPPVVRLMGPVTADPFVASGGQTAIRWTVDDSSVGHVEDPITIEYSDNNGRTWREINAGNYSRDDDGEEIWNVPDIRSTKVRVRVSARDATGQETSQASGRLAIGVTGFIADRNGRPYGFGTNPASVRYTKLPSGERARGIAVLSDGRSGYVLSERGKLLPFAVTGVDMPKNIKTKRFGGDHARGVVMRSDSSGYVLHRDGRLFAFGGAPKADVSKVWRGKNRARDVVLASNGRGGYVLDGYGKLHRFRVGGNKMPRKVGTTVLSSARAVSVVLRSDGKSGWVLDKNAKLHRFGGAPKRKAAGDGSGARARALLLLTEDAGYWVDGRGVLRRWGNAFGDPTRKVLPGYKRLRGAAM